MILKSNPHVIKIKTKTIEISGKKGVLLSRLLSKIPSTYQCLHWRCHFLRLNFTTVSNKTGLTFMIYYNFEIILIASYNVHFFFVDSYSSQSNSIFKLSRSPYSIILSTDASRSHCNCDFSQIQ